MAERYVVGDSITIPAQFTVDGVLTDPTAVTLVVTDPDNSSVTYTHPATITRNSAGDYERTVTVTTAGVWSFVWTGTGTAAGVQDGTVTVFDDVPLNTYGTIDELKKLVFSGATEDTVDDMLLQLAIEGASRWIDSYCERPAGFGRDTADTTRTFEPCDPYELTIDDLVSLTTLATDTAGDGTFETVWTAADYQLLPYNPLRYGVTWPYHQIRAVGARGFPYPAYGTGRRDLVAITGRFGWPAVPIGVKNACLLLADAAYERRKSPSGILGGFPDLNAVRVSIRVDPDVERWLDPFTRYSVNIA